VTIRKNLDELDRLIEKKHYLELPDYVQFPDPYKELALIRDVLRAYGVILHTLIDADKSSPPADPVYPALDAGPPRSTPRS